MRGVSASNKGGNDSFIDLKFWVYNLKDTLQVIDAIHDGLVIVEWEEMPVLGFLQPKSDIKYAPKEILRPDQLSEE